MPRAQLQKHNGSEMFSGLEKNIAADGISIISSCQVYLQHAAAYKIQLIIFLYTVTNCKLWSVYEIFCFNVELLQG